VVKTILLIEDNEDDVTLVRRSMTTARIANPVYVVGDGDEAIAYLKGEGAYGDRSKFPMPGILLLDLKMARTSGMEVLSWCRQYLAAKDLFIVVLSHHNEIREVNRAYALGARTFLVKPASREDFINLARHFPKYWELAEAAKRGPSLKREIREGATPGSTEIPPSPARDNQDNSGGDGISRKPVIPLEGGTGTTPPQARL